MATTQHPAATALEIHRTARWTPTDAAARIAINVAAVNADDVGCAAWQQDDNSVWIAIAAGLGANKWAAVTAPALSRVFYVDGLSVSPAPNGSIDAPFATIQAAINAVPVRVGTPAQTAPWTIRIAPGFYDEDLTLRPDGVMIFEPIGFLTGLGTLTVILGSTGFALRDIHVDGNNGLVGNPIATFRNFYFNNMDHVGGIGNTADVVLDHCFSIGTVDLTPGGRIGNLVLIGGSQASVITSLLLMKDGAGSGTVLGGPPGTAILTVTERSSIGTFTMTPGCVLVLDDCDITTLDATGCTGTVQGSRILQIVGDSASALSFDDYSAAWRMTTGGLGASPTNSYSVGQSSGASATAAHWIFEALDTNVIIARDGVNPWQPDLYLHAPTVPRTLTLPLISSWSLANPALGGGSFSRELVVKNRGPSTVAVTPNGLETIDGVNAPVIVAAGASLWLIASLTGWETL